MKCILDDNQILNMNSNKNYNKIVLRSRNRTLMQACNQEFFRAGEVYENKGTSINI